MQAYFVKVEENIITECVVPKNDSLVGKRYSEELNGYYERRNYSFTVTDAAYELEDKGYRVLGRVTVPRDENKTLGLGRIGDQYVVWKYNFGLSCNVYVGTAEDNLTLLMVSDHSRMSYMQEVIQDNVKYSLVVSVPMIYVINEDLTVKTMKTPYSCVHIINNVVYTFEDNKLYTLDLKTGKTTLFGTYESNIYGIDKYGNGIVVLTAEGLYLKDEILIVNTDDVEELETMGDYILLGKKLYKHDVLIKEWDTYASFVGDKYLYVNEEQVYSLPDMTLLHQSDPYELSVVLM